MIKSYKDETKSDESGNTFRILFNKSPDAMLLFDTNVFIDCNPAAIKMFKCKDREHLLSLDPFELSAEIQPNGRPTSEEILNYINKVNEEGSLLFEWLNKRTNGEQFHTEVLLTSIPFADKIIIHATLRDITDRKQAEEQLRKERELRKEFIQSSPAFFVAIDRNGKTLMMNKSMLKATGYKEREVIDKDYQQFFIPESEKYILNDILNKLISTNKSTVNENHILCKDGKKILVEWHGVPVVGKDGKLEYFFGVGIDITERRQTEEELKAAHSEVQKLKKQLEAENLYLKEEIKINHNFEELIGKSKPLRKVLSKVEQVASTNSTVLILGDTGTGKELIARAVHNFSLRSDRPLVKVNCTALPYNIIESELFGHEKGAFTGAYARKIGRFELANKGTIFLDEIGDLPMELQVKLLRVLQSGEFERLGNSKTINVDIRIIAATNRNLEKAIEKGTFREDLYYRLNVFPLYMPSLKERKDDIPFLVNHFIKKFCKKIGKKIDIIPQRIMTALTDYDWPGNIRELENIIERAVIISKGNKLEVDEWLPKKNVPGKSIEQSTLKDLERSHIIKILEMTHWKVSGENGAAKILGINPNTLVSRMKKLNIQR